MGPNNSTEAEIQGQSKKNNGLSAFCCNSSLCNNDNNIDNRMTEVNRRQNYNRAAASGNMMLSAGVHRSSDLAGYGKETYATTNMNNGYGSNGLNGAHNTASTANFKSNGMGDTVPQGLNGGSNLFDIEVEKQVKNALVIPQRNSQIDYIANGEQQFGASNSDMLLGAAVAAGPGNVSIGAARSQGTGGTGQGDASTTSKQQAITIHQQIQNEILASSAAMIEYKNRVIHFMNENPDAHQLNLEVISSASLVKGDLITIDPLGLCGNFSSQRAQFEEETNQELRIAPDSFTYFGSMAELPMDSNENSDFDMANKGEVPSVIVNDFVIPPRNKDSAEQHRGRHFQIWFDVGLSSQQQIVGYYIKDLGIGFGVFKRMDVESNDQVLMLAGLPTPALGEKGGVVGYTQMPQFNTGCIVLKDNMLINIGEAYIVVNLFPEGVDEDGPHSMLKLKIFGGSNNGEVYEYMIDDMQAGGREILLGRTPECDIKINDKLLSKTQCHIKLWYESPDNFRWLLHDGFKGKASTNGTWLYINEDMRVYDGMVFKANQTIFQASLSSMADQQQMLMHQQQLDMQPGYQQQLQ